MTPASTFDRLLNVLAERDVQYRIIEHEPVGRTASVSAIRGNAIEQAAKAMVVMVTDHGKSQRYYLAVVGGNTRVDFDTIKRLAGGSRAKLAPREKAEELTNCVMGAIPPVSFNPDLCLVVDSNLLTQRELYFNAGRLDRSMMLATKDYLAITKPLIMSIACES